MIAYTETVEAGAPYVLPLRGLPQLGTLDIDVHAAGSQAAHHRRPQRSRLQPPPDSASRPAATSSSKARSSRAARASAAETWRSRASSRSRRRGPEPIASAVVLVDTSASRGLGLPEQARMVRSVLSKMSPDALVTVACFDQEVVPLYEGKAARLRREGGQRDHRARRARRLRLRAARSAGPASRRRRTKAKRVVLVGDGVATAGETDAQKLKEKVERLRDAGVERMDAIAIGGIRDDAFLRTVVRGVLDRDGVVLDAKLGPDALARRLGEATSSGVPVKVEGATWSWPRTLDGLQAGDEVMVYARVDAGKPVKVSVGTQQFAPDLRSSDRPLVERAWAQAKIQSLIEAPTEDAASTKREIIALSTQHRVLSPHTSMLVLETDADYARFNIDRTATVDILTVQDGRIAVDHEPRSWEQRQAKLAESDKKKAGDDGWRRRRAESEPRRHRPPRPSRPRPQRRPRRRWPPRRRPTFRVLARRRAQRRSRRTTASAATR